MATYELVKHPAGFFAECEIEKESLKKLQNGGMFEVEVKAGRNPAFHRKMFAFFNFCFQYWSSDREFMDEKGQRNVFRKNLTCLAGYYHEYYNIKGEVRIEAKSLAYSNMEPEEFEQCYNAMIGAAMRHIFTGCGPEIENQLMSFF